MEKELKVLLVWENDNQPYDRSCVETVAEMSLDEPNFDDNSILILGQQNACIVRINTIDGKVIP